MVSPSIAPVSNQLSPANDLTDGEESQNLSAENTEVGKLLLGSRTCEGDELAGVVGGIGGFEKGLEGGLECGLESGPITIADVNECS